MVLPPTLGSNEVLLSFEGLSEEDWGESGHLPLPSGGEAMPTMVSVDNKWGTRTPVSIYRKGTSLPSEYMPRGHLQLEVIRCLLRFSKGKHRLEKKKKNFPWCKKGDFSIPLPLLREFALENFYL